MTTQPTKPDHVRVRVKHGAQIVLDRDMYGSAIMAKPGEWIELPEREMRNAAIRRHVETQEDLDAAAVKVEQSTEEQSANRAMFESLKRGAQQDAKATVGEREAVAEIQEKLASEDRAEDKSSDARPRVVRGKGH